VGAAALALGLSSALSGCGGSSGSDKSPSAASGSSASGQATASVSAGAVRQVSTFVAPFSVTVPDWVDPAPSESTAHFVTWQTPDQSRGIRVMAPIEVFKPGSSEPTSPPRDFGAYLSSLRKSGARISHVSHRPVDGRPALVLTLGAPPGNALDGALGCPEADMAASDCFGPQDELVLRLAYIEVNGQPVLIWEKDPSGSTGSIDYRPFDAMLASIAFR
jgi:hypothetical protein